MLVEGRQTPIFAEARAVSEYGVHHLEMPPSFSRRRGYGEGAAKPCISGISKMSSCTTSPPSQSRYEVLPAISSVVHRVH